MPDEARKKYCFSTFIFFIVYCYTVEVGPVSLYRLVHCRRRLESKAGLLSPLLTIILLESVSLTKNRIDVQALVNWAEVNQVLGRKVLFRIEGALRLALVVNLA